MVFKHRSDMLSTVVHLDITRELQQRLSLAHEHYQMALNGSFFYQNLYTFGPSQENSIIESLETP